MTDLPRYITCATIKGRTYYKAQRVNGRADQAAGFPYWRYQKHFLTLEDAIAFIAAEEASQ